MSLSINECMALQKAVRERVNELKNLRDEVAVERKTSYLLSDDREKIESLDVKYDVKKVDKKITELEIFLFKVDSKIKQKNASTQVDIAADVDKLLSPLE